ncbi:MAG: RES domain-containing protein [Nitrospirota bacterium]|nr:RES domain-containing protein [Nitrospirota bacterium]
MLAFGKMTYNSKKWTLPSPHTVMECIEKWRKHDLRKMSDSEIDTELSNFLDSLEVYPVSTTETQPFKFWRIRKFEYLFKDVSECWEPPSSKTPLGRCNSKCSPVLYVSDNLETPFEELNIQVGEPVYTIKYRVTDPLNLKRIVPKELITTDENHKPIYDDQSMLSYQILREFVRSEFLKPVGKGTEYLHKISSSMCRVWFHSDESDGWLYPSVQSNKNNIALKPESARKKIEIKDIRIVRLVQKEHVSNHIHKFRAHPFYNLVSMAIETDFKGKVEKDVITWSPSTEIGGIF